MTDESYRIRPPGGVVIPGSGTYVDDPSRLIPPPPGRYKIGDVVFLRSGGPPMTVYAVHGVTDTCWFVDGRLQRDAFDEAELASDTALHPVVDLADLLAGAVTGLMRGNGDAAWYADLTKLVAQYWDARKQAPPRIEEPKP